MENLFVKIDKKFFPIFNKRIKNKFFDWFLPKYTYLGGLVFVITFTIFLIVFGNDSIRNIGMQLGFALLISQGITYSLKAILKRERPYNVLEEINTYGLELRDYSFPSGHSSSSFTIASIIFLNNPIIGIFALIYAIFIAISRIYLGVHYPTDVIAGIGIGLLSSIFVYNFLLSFIDKIINIIF